MAKPWWRETIETVVWAAVLALILRTLVIQAFWIPSGSMIPTLEVGDRVVVLKFWYHLPKIEPKRGEIVVFHDPANPNRDLIKRLIGLPGETVSMTAGKVFIDGKEIAEPYVKNTDTYDLPPTPIPEGEYYCLGDNRPNSQDSRFWGTAKRSDLIGPAVFRYWPPSRIGTLK